MASELGSETPTKLMPRLHLSLCKFNNKFFNKQKTKEAKSLLVFRICHRPPRQTGEECGGFTSLSHPSANEFAPQRYKQIYQYSKKTNEAKILVSRAPNSLISQDIDIQRVRENDDSGIKD